MIDNQAANTTTNRMRVICVTGGKGGIGKTTVAVNLALIFARQKKNVLLFDADLGLANVDIRLGLSPKKHLHDFLSGSCGLDEICMTGPHGLKIVPSASGIPRMAELNSMESAAIIHAFSNLTAQIDIMIIDMAPGISSQVIDFTHASQDILVVICNDPASLMDSYAIIKILHQKYARDRFGVVVNKVLDLQEGYDVFCKFQDVTAKFINVGMHYIGHIPQDDYISIASREGVAVVEKYPQAPATTAFQDLSNGIQHWQQDSSVGGGIQFFFERLLENPAVNKEKPCIV
jgi:flagellar biosynthesis protein FlhG